MSYFYNGPWNEEVSSKISNFINENWLKWENENADSDLIEFIIDLIKEKKTMNDIADELKDIELPTEKISFFVEGFEKLLTNSTPASTTPAPKKASPTTTTTTTNNPPLQTTSNKAPATSSKLPSSSNHAINMALSSSRDGSTRDNNFKRKNISEENNEDNNNQNKRRNFDNQNITQNNRNNNRNNNQFNNDRNNRNNNQNTNQNNQGNQRRNNQNNAQNNNNQNNQNSNDISDPALLNTVKYFEQMNAIAQQSGFKNAQEMLASQKEMLALMSSAPVAPVAPVVPPIPPVPYQANYAMEMDDGSSFVPPPSYGYSTFQGRGAGGRTRPPGRGFGGRGRGYMGNNPATNYVAPGYVPSNPFVPPSSDGEKATPAAEGSAAEGSAAEGSAAEGSAAAPQDPSSTSVAPNPNPFSSTNPFSQGAPNPGRGQRRGILNKVWVRPGPTPTTENTPADSNSNNNSLESI